MDGGFLASHDPCWFRADGMPTVLAAASVSVSLALAHFLDRAGGDSVLLMWEANVGPEDISGDVRAGQSMKKNHPISFPLFFG